MRPNGQITAVLLVAAFAAVGCSKRGETTQAKSASPDLAQEKSVTAPGALKQADGEGFVANATPKITGSFADGEAAYKAKKYGDATAIFESYTERRPGNAWGHYMLGLSTWKAGDVAKAEGAFEKALSIDPNHFKSLLNLGRVLIDQKRFDDALVTLTHAEGVDPDSIDVQRLLARTYHAQGKTDEAVEAYRRAIELNELDAWSMNNLGLVLLETKRADEALPLLAKAVELRRDVPEFHNNLGMALEHTGRFRAAATAYSGALSANPGYDKAKQNLARVEAVKGGTEEPFKVEGAPKGSIAEAEIPVDEKSASK
jgi:tetratricopeptide (TPR) repeat protein